MKTFKPTFVLLAISLAFITGLSCKKRNNLDADGLPKATQTGAMLFACKVNGVNWIAKRSIYNVRGKIVKDTLSVSANILSSNNEIFGIRILNKEVSENVAYRLNESNSLYGLYISDKDCFFNAKPNGYGEVKSVDGEVTFTKIDIPRNIVSGIFWFNVSTDKCGELKVTNGRFDINIGTGNIQ